MSIIEDSTIVVERAVAKSKQPHLSKKNENILNWWVKSVERWSKDAIKDAPNLATDNRERDRWLTDFWKQEPLLSGVLSSVISIDKNRGWELVGGRNQVKRYTNILRATGWRNYASKQSLGYWSQDIGTISEIGRVGKNGPLGALWHVDSTRVVIDGDLQYPLKYYPQSGPVQKWRESDYMQAYSLPSGDETFPGLGYSAVSRAMDLVIIMVGIYRHDKEMLQSAMAKGLLLMSGIDGDDWDDAMVVNKARMTQKEQEYFNGLSIFFSDLPIDAKLMTLSQLPENFSLKEFTNVLMNGYALCFGYDAREFWPVSQGSLGTGNETELQAVKASGKGGLDFALAYQDNLQMELPEALHFEFEQRNEAGLIVEAEAIKSYAEAVNEMAAPAGNQDQVTLTSEERRQLYAAKGYIPEEWTVAEEMTSETDTGDAQTRERLLESDHVQRACRINQDSPIVRYLWPQNRTKILWRSGAEALHRRSYPVRKRKKRQEEDEEILFQNDLVTITRADVDRAETNWDQRQDPEFEGLLSATSIEE